MATSVTKNRKFDKKIDNKIPIAIKLWVWLIPFYI
jgi:hypothetical protein